MNKLRVITYTTLINNEFFFLCFLMKRGKRNMNPSKQPHETAPHPPQHHYKTPPLKHPIALGQPTTLKKNTYNTLHNQTKPHKQNTCNKNTDS